MRDKKKPDTPQAATPERNQTAELLDRATLFALGLVLSRPSLKTRLELKRHRRE
jgi:hypothetical protein